MTDTSNEARLAISFTRTIQIKQFEPIQVFGSVSFGSTTPETEIEALLGRFDSIGNLVAEQVINLADARAESIRGGQPQTEEVARTVRPAASGARKAPAGRKQNPIVTVEGREFESWTNRDGNPALTGKCDTCGEPAYVNQSTNQKTGVTYSPEQNVASDIKFKGGIFCKAHKPAWNGGKPAARPAPRQQEEEDDIF